ncbi:FxSxx-COOH system tetratricopeptide repeat protein [Streptomyces buecherae]|uniref:FxSxx-COOH system tetratricopeptide repeat protein n=1 Tax=Streptomyces buecherae TaxID=2763006 RepID=UPI003647503F
MAVVRKSPAAAERQPVTISYAGFNRAWAAWIGDRLERHGHRVAFQRWDPPVETPLEDALRDLLLAEGRVLLLLSDWYFQLGPRTHDQWNQALRAVVAPNTDRFAAVTVTDAAMPTATAALNVTELGVAGPREAERRLLARLGTPYSAAPATAAETTGPRFPRDQPRVWGGVPRRNIRFTGREGALSEIYHQLNGAEASAAVVTLLGMSGVGKTQTAAEYVYRFGSEYDMVWWVPADQRGTLRQRLAELAPALGLSAGPEYGERLRAVHDALRRGTPYSRWLLVLDGADDPETVADLLPSGPGHVLITSQNRDWDEHNTSLVEIPVYDREESVAFVRRRARRISAHEADLLSDALGDLPLALDQTAGSLNDSTMPVEEYIELLRDGADIEVGLKVAADFPMTYYTAFSILLNRLRESVPEAVDLLRLCSFFAPGPVPLGLLRELPARDLPEQLRGLMDDPLRWTSSISKLVQYSVVRTENPEDGTDEPTAGTEVLHLHRMVHQTVRAGMPEEDRAEYSRVARRALANSDPGRPTDTRLWPRYAELVPHLEASGSYVSTHGAVQRLVLNCLRYLFLSGEYRTGLQIAERVTPKWHELLGPTHPRVWDLAYHHVNLLRSVGRYAEAEQLDRAAADHLRAERGDHDLDLLRAVTGLAADLRALARYDEALDLQQSVLREYTELVGEQDSRTLGALNNLAVSYRVLGRYTEALEMDRRALEARREHLRPRHNWTLFSEINYAWDLRLLGRYEEAISIQEPSVEVHRDVMGPDNPQTLRAEHNLAMCLYRQGDRTRGITLLGDMLERCERVLGDTDPLTLMAASSYGCMQREHGDLDLARELGERVLGRYREMLGPRHPYAVGSSVNHALVLRAAGERQPSAMLIEEALATMTAAVGERHPWTLGIALNATATRNLMGDPEGAAELSRRTSHLAAEVLGPQHPLALSCQVALAADLRVVRDRQQAEKVEEAALSALSDTLGSQHVHTISARSRARPFWDFENHAH